MFAAGVGVFAAIAVAAFKLLVFGAEWLAVGWIGEDWGDLPPFLVLLVPTAGGLLVGIALRAGGVSEEPDHGVTEVIRAATMDVEEFPYREVPLKVSLAAVSLGTGASLGPEDPAVEIGGAAGEWLGRRQQLEPDSVRALVASGAAGGVSALLFTPLAGILFSIEVFAVRLWSRATLLVIVSGLVAWAGMRLLLPQAQIDLQVPVGAVELLPARGLLFCLLLGLVAGLVSVGQILLTHGVRRGFLSIAPVPRWLKPAIGGLLLGAAGLVLPQALGTGYATTESLVAGEVLAPGLLVALLLGKMLLTAVSFGSGFLGGFFAPAFFIGTTLGALLASGTGAWLAPDVGAGTLALIGTAAALAGMVHAPLTAAATAAALSGSWGILPHLLVSCFASYLLARLILPGSLYTHTISEQAPDAAPSEGDFRKQPDLG
jgi:chloride channel protein, CIC family